MTTEEIRSTLKQSQRDNYLWALFCCRQNSEMAFEVLQITYLKILEGKAKYSGTSAFKTWIFSVIKNTAIDTFNDERKRERKFSKLNNRFSTNNGRNKEKELQIAIEYNRFATISLEKDNQTELLEEALNQLSERQKEIIMLVFYWDFTIEKSAEIMRISIGSARTHYERGKSNLRSILESNKLL